MARTLVYTDYAYHRIGDCIFSERAFSLFLARVAGQLDGQMLILGRLSEEPVRANYPIGEGIGFLPLPFYRSLASPGAILGILRSLRAAWAAVGEADRVWLFGPHPLSFALAAFARLRGRPIALGVRQDLPALIRHRHSGRAIRAAAALLEWGHRRLARSSATVVVGPVLAEHYARSRRLLEISVSLVSSDQIASLEQGSGRDYDGPKTLLSVGRLDREKSPKLLVDVLGRLLDDGGEWRLEICGEGPLRADLERAVRDRGLETRVELPGYVPIDQGLLERYARAHFLLHSSLTEGLPQTLLEALAAGLPVVSSDVGGIRAALGDRVRLFPAGDAAAAAGALAELAADREQRSRLVAAGREWIREHTVEIESRRAADFISG